MSKLAPTWQNLPPHFKQSVVERLAYKDRCSLRRCSSSDLSIVDTSKLVLNDVAIFISQLSTMFSFSDDGETIHLARYSNLPNGAMKIEWSSSPRIFKPGKNEKYLAKGVKILENLEEDPLDDVELAIQDFMRAIQKLSVNLISINEPIIKDYYPEADRERLLGFRSRLLKALSTQKKMVNAETLRLKWHSDEDQVMEILSRFQPGILKKIDFIDRKATWNMGKIARSEQWMRVQTVFLEVMTDLEVDQLLHANEIQAHVDDMSPEDVWRVIQSFLKKPLPGASFHFSFQNNEPNLEQIQQQFDVPPVDQPIEAQSQIRKILCRRFLHTQRFQMPQKDLVLVVQVSGKEVLGSVCHVDQVNEEAKVEMGMLR